MIKTRILFMVLLVLVTDVFAKNLNITLFTGYPSHLLYPSTDPYSPQTNVDAQIKWTVGAANHLGISLNYILMYQSQEALNCLQPGFIFGYTKQFTDRLKLTNSFNIGMSFGIQNIYIDKDPGTTGISPVVKERKVGIAFTFSEIVSLPIVLSERFSIGPFVRLDYSIVVETEYKLPTTFNYIKPGILFEFSILKKK